MPVTARLSKRFYDRLGDDIANELVDWFNAVDATYRLDLKETNELNFARFDAKVSQRFAEQEARFEKRLAEIEAKFEKRFGKVDLAMESLRIEMSDRDSRLLKWMVICWSTNTVAIIGLIVAFVTSR